MIQVTVLPLPGGMASSLAITLDALNTANRVSLNGGRPAPFSVRTLRLGHGAAPVFGPGDLVILPALGSTSDLEVTARLATSAVRRVARVVAQAHAAGATVAASCASTFILAEAGLLAGREATTTWWLSALFRRLYPEVTLNVDRIVVTDGRVISAGAAMAQMDLMLSLIARFASAGLSEACARYLLLDQRKSQSPYMAVNFLAGQDETIARAEAWVRANIERDFSMDEIAGAVGMLPRTFARRLIKVCGLSPVRFTQRVRVEEAERLLETTRLSVDEVARRVGYAEPSTLRRLIRRQARRSPAELRRAG